MGRFQGFFLTIHKWGIVLSREKTTRAGKDAGKPAGKKHLGLIVTFAVNLLIVGYIAVREFILNKRDVQAISLGGVEWGFLALGACCFLAALLMEYVKYRKMILATAARDDRTGALRCAIFGKYYDNITPFGAGGQPFQVVFLKQRGFSAGVSAALPIVGFLTQQLAFILLAAVVFIFNPSVIEDNPVIRYGAYLGLVMYALLPLAILLFAAFPRAFRKVVGGGVKLLERLHIIRRPEQAERSIFGSLDEYVASLKTMKSRPLFFPALLLLSLVYQLAILSVPFFMLRAFGGSNGWWTVFSLTAYIYAAITIVPTPGNAGAAEGSFYVVFSALEGGMLFWGMIAWRVIVYYLWLIVGLGAVARNTAAPEPKQKRPVPAEGKLSVVQFCDTYYPTVDGVIRVVDAYARELSAAGHKVCVVCPRVRGADDSALPYEVIRTPSLHAKGATYALPLPIMTWRLKRYFRKNHVDVIHLHSPFFASYLGIVLGRRRGIPVAATFHSKYYDDTLATTHSRLCAELMAAYVADFYSKADMVWACCPGAAETLRSYGYRGHVRVMPNGVERIDLGGAEELKRRAAQKFGIPEGRRVLLFVGHQIWQKNIKLILDSSKLLAERRDDCLTVLAGEGYHSKEITKYAISLGVGGRILFTGQVDDPKLLYGLYLLSDLLFFPSRYDNSPLVLREAAQAALPALLSEGADAASVVKDGFNGYTAPDNMEAMARKIEAILDSPDRETVGAAARETIPHFWPEVARLVAAAYRGFGAEAPELPPEEDAPPAPGATPGATAAPALAPRVRKRRRTRRLR